MSANFLSFVGTSTKIPGNCMSNTDTAIQSLIIETRPIDWKKLEFVQQDNFKEFTPYEKAKLKHSIISNNFIEPFYVWESNNTLYCLDGKHRSIILNILLQDGIKVPDLLPATFLRLETMEQAAKLVLLFSSHYAHITKGGLDDFVKLYDLDIDKLLDEISLPDLPMMDTETLPIPDDLLSDGKNKPATMKLTFENPDDVERAIPLVEKLLSENFKNAFFSVSSGEI